MLEALRSFGRFLWLVLLIGPRLCLHQLRYLLRWPPVAHCDVTIAIRGPHLALVIYLGCDCGRVFWHDRAHINDPEQVARMFLSPAR